MSAPLPRSVTRVFVVMFAILPFVFLLPRPALGCSCAPPGDIEALIAESPGVVVGTLLDKRLTGAEFDMAAVFRVEVEEWVKGDLGPEIDVYTAGDGAGCGIEAPIGTRVGLFLSVQDNRLTSNLCRQMSPEVLEAAAQGPVMSKTGIPFMLVGGWNSPTLRVLDESGGLITRLDSRRGPDDFADTSRQALSFCPGGRHLVHRTTLGLVVWDLRTMERVAEHDLPEYAGLGVYAVSCRAEDASIVWYALDGVGGAAVVEVFTGEEILTVPNSMLYVGGDHVISQTIDYTEVVRHDLTTGESIVLHTKGAEENIGVYPAPHPNNGLTALVETVYPLDGSASTSTLTVLDESGMVVDEHAIPMEGGVPIWLDDTTIAVTASDFTGNGEQTLYLLDIAEGTTTTLPGWTAWDYVASDGAVYGITAGTILRGDPMSGEMEPVGTIADESAVALHVIEDGEAIEVDEEPETPIGVVTPPLTPDSGIAVLEGGSTPETQTQSSNLARVVFLTLAGAGLVTGLVAYMRRERQVKPPSAF